MGYIVRFGRNGKGYPSSWLPSTKSMLGQRRIFQRGMACVGNVGQGIARRRSALGLGSHAVLLVIHQRKIIIVAV